MVRQRHSVDWNLMGVSAGAAERLREAPTGAVLGSVRPPIDSSSLSDHAALRHGGDLPAVSERPAPSARIRFDRPDAVKEKAGSPPHKQGRGRQPLLALRTR